MKMIILFFYYPVNCMKLNEMFSQKPATLVIITTAKDVLLSSALIRYAPPLIGGALSDAFV